MPRPCLDANHTLHQGRLQRVDGLLDAAFLGDEVVELFAHDGWGDEDLVDGRQTGRDGVCACLWVGRGDAALGVGDDAVGAVEGLLQDGGVGLQGGVEVLQGGDLALQGGYCGVERVRLGLQGVCGGFGLRDVGLEGFGERFGHRVQERVFLGVGWNGRRRACGCNRGQLDFKWRGEEIHLFGFGSWCRLGRRDWRGSTIMWGRVGWWERGLGKPAIGLLVCWVRKRLLTGDIGRLLWRTPEGLRSWARGYTSVSSEGCLSLWM